MKVSTRQPSPEGARLREHRIRLDMTQHVLAERMGRSNAVVSFIECGMYRPGVTLIRLFAAALGLSLADEQELFDLRASAWSPPAKVELPRLKVGVSNED